MTEAFTSALMLTVLFGGIGWFLKWLIWDGTKTAFSGAEYGRKFSAYIMFFTIIGSAHNFIRKDFIDAVFSLIITIILFPTVAYGVGYIFGFIKLSRRGQAENSTGVESGRAESVATDDHWEQAYKEVNGGERVTAIWARAFSEADGDENKAKARYLSMRFAQLSKSNTDKGYSVNDGRQTTAKSTLTPQPIRSSNEAPVPEDAQCPNCKSLISSKSIECWRCKAAFGENSAWKPLHPYPEEMNNVKVQKQHEEAIERRKKRLSE